MYDDELRNQVLKLHFEDGRTIESLADEFGVSQCTIKKWTKKYKDDAETNEKLRAALKTMEENQKLKKKLEELEKENDFLKKAAAFFAKESKQ